MKKTMKKYINNWLPVIVWAGIIFAFSSYPTTRASRIHWQDFIVKKTAHIVEYGVLSTLLYRGLKLEGLDTKRAGKLTMFIAIFYGATDEFHQSFTPGREPTVRDVLFDTIGASLAIYFIWYQLQNLPAKLRNLARNLQLD